MSVVVAPATLPTLLSVFFRQLDPAQFGCFDTSAEFSACCGEERQPLAECFSDATPDDRSWLLCCSEYGMLGSKKPLQTYASPRAAFKGLDVSQMYPRLESSFCVSQEAGKLLETYLSLERCFKAFGEDSPGWGPPGRRSCLEQRLRVAERNATWGRGVGCWPSTLGAAAALAPLAAAVQQPGARAAVRGTFDALNVFIWEVTELQLRQKRLPRFLPSPVNLGYPHTLHNNLEGVRGPHRGDVVLRLLRDVDVGKRNVRHAGADDVLVATGLTFVELGVGTASLSRWLLRRVAGLVGTAHLIDLYEEHVLSIDNVAGKLRSDGFQSCGSQQGAKGDAYRRLQFCGSSDLKIQVHKAFSAQTADIFAPASVDMVFVDAGHGYKEASADIKAWWPKLAVGGIMAGHDFRYRVGGVREAVSDFFVDRTVHLDSDSLWWTVK